MTSRFPERFPADTTIEDVDLDQEEVFAGGERLTEARATELAAQTLREVRKRNLIPGRKSLGGDGSHSPVIQFRVPAHLRASLEARARTDNVTASVVARRALESYLAPQADEPHVGAARPSDVPVPVLDEQARARVLEAISHFLDSIDDQVSADDPQMVLLQAVLDSAGAGSGGDPVSLQRAISSRMGDRTRTPGR